MSNLRLTRWGALGIPSNSPQLNLDCQQTTLYRNVGLRMSGTIAPFSSSTESVIASGTFHGASQRHKRGLSTAQTWWKLRRIAAIYSFYPFLIINNLQLRHIELREANSSIYENAFLPRTKNILRKYNIQTYPKPINIHCLDHRDVLWGTAFVPHVTHSLPSCTANTSVKTARSDKKVETSH